MPKIALNNDNIAISTATNHIRYKKWEYQYTTPTYCSAYDKDGNCISWGGGTEVYDWNYYYTDATITGKVNSSVNNVYINGKPLIVKGDATTEKDTYNIPSGGQYVSGSHDIANGSITSGNSSRVYANGKLVCTIGSNVNTHAGTNTTISSPGSTNVYIN